VLVTDNDRVYGLGHNADGQLGLGHTNPALQPTEIKHPLFQMEGIKFLSCGAYHTYIVTGANTILSFGSNSYGQLARPSSNKQKPEVATIPSECFQRHDSSKNITHLACGYYCAHVVIDSDFVLSVGNNLYGQLAIGEANSNHRDKFTRVNCVFDGSGIKEIHAGYRVTSVITNAQTLWVVGRLNVGNSSAQFSDAANGTFTMIKFGLERVTHVACGNEHMVVVLNSQKVLVAGNGQYGQLGGGSFSGSDQLTQVNPEWLPKNKPVSSVACGDFFTVIVFGYAKLLRLQTKMLDIQSRGRLTDVVIRFKQ